jgi:hypothetical protein
VGDGRKPNDPLAVERAKASLVKVAMMRHFFCNFPTLHLRPVFFIDIRHKLPIARYLSPTLSNSLVADKIIQ